MGTWFLGPLLGWVLPRYRHMKGWSTLLGIALHTPACMATMGGGVGPLRKLPPNQPTLKTHLQLGWFLSNKKWWLRDVQGSGVLIRSPQKSIQHRDGWITFTKWEATKISPKFQGGFWASKKSLKYLWCKMALISAYVLFDLWCHSLSKHLSKKATLRRCCEDMSR